MDKKHDDTPIVCDLTVFSAETRKEMADLPEMFKVVEKVQELDDGYAFQFPNESGMFMRIATFVEHERQCCPFYNFSLVAEPNQGPFWLHLTGGEGVKEFMEATWTDIEGAVPKQLILTGSENDLEDTIKRITPIMADVMAGSKP